MELDFKRLGDGGYATTVNGKTFRVLSAYSHPNQDGLFFLVVAGQQALQFDDLEEHWKIVRGDHGQYLALNQRSFSYHLSIGEEIPLGVNWPRLKAPFTRFAVVGANEQMIRGQVELLLAEYAPKIDIEDLDVIKAEDLCGSGPDAWLIKL